MKINFEDIFNTKSIIRRAAESWDMLSDKDKYLKGKKYSHLFDKKLVSIDFWINDFFDLTSKQQILLIKGELIRTYDALPNADKTKIKDILKLSSFSPKWYFLPSIDKKKIIYYIL